MTTERLGMNDLLESQAGAYTVINENMRLLEALAGGVVDKDLSSPPISPTAGDVYIVNATATGAWLDHEDDLAHWYNGAWAFYTPPINLLMYIADELSNYRYSATGWLRDSQYGGRLYKSITGNITLTQSESSNDIIDVYGTLSGAATITIPVIEKTWVINNATTGGFEINIEATGGSGSVTVPNGAKVIIYNDGTNVAPAMDAFPYGIKIGGSITVPLYSVASQPSTVGTYGQLIGVTDGNAGNLCLAMSDGVTWKRIVLGANVNAIV